MIVKSIALTRALAMLRASGVQFAVIDGEGNKHGDLELAPVPKVVPRKKNLVPRGAMKAIYKEPIEKLAVGEATVVPYGKFESARDRNSLRGAISSFASRLWGHGSCITHTNGVGIEVLRVL